MRTTKTGGQLRVGNPGNRGGLGAMSNRLREKMRGSLEDRLNTLENIIDDDEIHPREKLRALELYLKYAVGVAKDADAWNRWDVVQLVADLGAVVARHVDAGTLSQIKRGWREILTTEAYDAVTEAAEASAVEENHQPG